MPKIYSEAHANGNNNNNNNNNNALFTRNI